MRFVCDEMLGKLARWLRILGYDTRYFKIIDDGRLLRLASEERRAILTRDRHLSQLRLAAGSLLLESDAPREQLKQVLSHFALTPEAESQFTRCLECNTVLQEIAKEAIKDRLWPFIYQTQKQFRFCPDCNKIFWPGTHVQRMQQKLEVLLGQVRS